VWVFDTEGAKAEDKCTLYVSTAPTAAIYYLAAYSFLASASLQLSLHRLSNGSLTALPCCRYGSDPGKKEAAADATAGVRTK
jgi:hypothetical protein